MFTERLDHTRVLYFTITVFSTVGFGDITPRADLARIIVSIQMLLDLDILGSCGVRACSSTPPRSASLERETTRISLDAMTAPTPRQDHGAMVRHFHRHLGPDFLPH